MVGPVRSEFESIDAKAEVGNIGPMGSVRCAASGVADPCGRRRNWDREVAIGGAEIWDVLRSTFQLRGEGSAAFRSTLPKTEGPEPARYR